MSEEEDGETAQFFVGGNFAGLHVGYHSHKDGVGGSHVEAFEDFEPGGVEDEVAGHCHGFELFVVHSCCDLIGLMKKVCFDDAKVRRRGRGIK